ncbi:hypothetical protein HJG53_01050 [Sphingomonas sp. ID1715]|uniref:hypothetical protein n=1 Tax=Sphingomonas sp. ID1715 TaxID=1656898 RepID=UPI001488CEFE|nr:hypothetical protein [Sphingomonas sp. ID1715]NNM75496.1 hypothetical protein [Sphingomonas sp. ID1715]
MKVAFALPLLMMLNPAADAPPVAATAQAAAADNLSVEAPWTAKLSKSDAGKLQISVMERRGSMLGVGVALAELEGLTAADLASNRSVTFVLRREAGTVTFSGRFKDGLGEGTLRYTGNPDYWAKIAGMGLRWDEGERRAQLLALPLLDVRTDYIAALRREGAMGTLGDYVGMKAVGVAPEMVREVKPLIAGELQPHDLMSFAALGVTPDYAREMRAAFSSLRGNDLSSMKAMGVSGADIARIKALGLEVTPQGAAGMKALGVTPAYVQEMRAAGARIRTANDAQSFRALGITPAAVRRAVERGRANPSASDVMEMSMR